MEAPNKIYINGFSAFCTVPDKKDDVEYIRKEALLKKISELRTIPHDHAMARDNAFIEVIGIIESL